VPAELDSEVHSPGEDEEKEVSGDDYGMKSRMSVLFVVRKDHHAAMKTFETFK
jgi:hypothetical protein